MPFNWQFTNNDSVMNKHIQQCPYNNRSQHYGIQPREGSPLVDCKHGCGAVIHHCDVKEHEKVCWNKIVPCINVIYGCEVSLPRHKMNVHLKHCSASVVICKFAWERVDRNTASEVTNDDHPADENEENTGEKFLEDFCYKDMEQIKEDLEAKERNKELSLMIQPCPIPAYFYPNVVSHCNETVRRDDFENHYKTQHDIIHCELGGWLVHHCPLYEYGCNFSISRLLPAAEECKLIYSNHMQKFATAEKDILVMESENSAAVQGWYATRLQQQRELAIYGYDDIPVDPISQLPTEVLYTIIRYLDSTGLFCLSLTSKFLRDACHNAVKGNMVQLVWQYQDDEWKDLQVCNI